MAAASKRTERTAASRERILDAAVEVLVESGYSGASTLEIQRRADVSRGRLTHHFPSRETLLVAAVSHLVETRVRQLYDARGMFSTGAARVDEAVELLWQTFRQPYFWAAVELWVAARSSPSLAEALLPVERELYVGIRRQIDKMCGEELVAKPHYRTLRTLLFTSMRGVALTYSFSPREREPHLVLWKEAARALLEIKPSKAPRRSPG